MYDLITTLAALSTFALWSVLALYAGMAIERKRADRAQRLRIAAFIRSMQRPAKRPDVPEHVRKAAQA